ncbi:MAG: hypothetical protein ACHQJ7_02715 [Vicinamibacteria bacterium]|jgi:hypothetical protein
MKLVPIKVALAVLAVGALSAGCATRLEMGPGYYHYDSRLASAPATVEIAPATVTVQEPVVVYREPAVVKYRY